MSRVLTTTPRTVGSWTRFVPTASTYIHRPSRCRIRHSLGVVTPARSAASANIASPRATSSGWSSAVIGLPSMSPVGYPRTRVADGLQYRTIPPGSTMTMTSDECCTSERNRASPWRAARSDTNRAFSRTAVICRITMSTATRISPTANIDHG